MQEMHEILEKLVNDLALQAFGRKPRKGECVMCGGSSMMKGDFRDEVSWRESKISYQCQACQDETDKMAKAMEDE